MSTSGWIAVDFDGTLVEYDKWVDVNHIGKPIPRMVERVKRWIAEGKDVRIFTARVAGQWRITDVKTGVLVDVITPIQEWCREHLGKVLPVTNIKDFGMIELWDDRAVQVIPNTGETLRDTVRWKLFELQGLQQFLAEGK